MTLVATLFISLFITLAFVPILRGFALKVRILDIPDERKVHARPMPKIGGLAMALGFVVPILLWLPLDRFVMAVLIGAAIIVAEGFIDDKYTLGYKPKLLGQVAAALVVVLYGGVQITSLGTLVPEGFTLPWAMSLPLTLVVIVGITNAVNLADGLDGLAGGIVLISFLCIAIIAWKIGDSTVLVMSLAMLGALFGFLSFNTYPASVFMGDAGSQFLGFMAIVLSLELTQGNPALSPALPLLVVGLPAIDTILVTLERIDSGRSPFAADNNHFHHKLLGTGLFHTEAVFIIYLVQSAFVLSAYMVRFFGDWFVLGLYLSLFLGIMVFSRIAFRPGFRFGRSELFDQGIKGKLRFLKDRGSILAAASLVLYTLPPALLILSCLMAGDMPRAASLAALALAPAVAFLWLKGTGGMARNTVRTVLYFLIPFVIFFGREEQAFLQGFNLDLALFAAYAACILAAIVMMRLDRRRSTFKASPMDFLIVVITLCVSPLLGALMDMGQSRMFLVQILIFFYTYEILLNEQRKGRTVVFATTVGALMIVALKGVFA